MRSSAHAMLRDLASDGAHQRWLIQGSGIVGDATYVSLWLIGHMAKPETARLAGEAFTLITGADLTRSDCGVRDPTNSSPAPTRIRTTRTSLWKKTRA